MNRKGSLLFIVFLLLFMAVPFSARAEEAQGPIRVGVFGSVRYLV